jgi:hypothetical protein
LQLFDYEAFACDSVEKNAMNFVFNRKSIIFAQVFINGQRGTISPFFIC